MIKQMLIAFVICCLFAFINVQATYVPLYNYIDTDDGVFAWKDTGKTEVDDLTGAKLHYLELTSQKWLDERYVAKDDLIWKHMLVIIEPKDLYAPETCIIYATGGSKSTSKAEGADLILGVALANEANAYVGLLFQVPNQSITVFGKSLSEDKLMGFTWANFMRNIKNTTHPVPVESIINFPMTKAVIKAQDAIEQWSQQRQQQQQQQDAYANIPITQFILAGASKRGLTTALALSYEGAKPADKRRVLGGVPMVYDAFNFATVLPIMTNYYGNWSFAVGPYRDAGVMDFSYTWELQVLASVIDPLSSDYAQGFSALPKLLLGATGDEFFTLDNVNHFWDIMPGKNTTYKMLVDNADHVLATNLGPVIDSMGGFANTLIYLNNNNNNNTNPQDEQDQQQDYLPKFNWVINSTTNSISLQIQDDINNNDTFHVSKISIHRAYSSPSIPNRRDFRMLRANIPGSCDAPNLPVSDDKCLVNIPWNTTQIKDNTEYTAYNQDDKTWYVTYTEDLTTKPDNSFVAFYIDVELTKNITVMNKDGEEIIKKIKQKFTTNPAILPDIRPYDVCKPGNCRLDVV
eukprot:UN04710